MSGIAKLWGETIGEVIDANGLPILDTTVQHIRAAIIQSGFVRRSRLTSGLREAYQPFGINSDALRTLTDEALRLLLLTGDIDVFSTAAGRAYTTTVPRRIDWGGAHVAVLGGIALEADVGAVRRVTPSEGAVLPAAEVSLADELGRPDWRTALVCLGGADVVDGNPSALFSFVAALATSGERFALEPIETISVLSGHGDFFGKPEPAPSGRWTRVVGAGTFPAAIYIGYQWRNVVLHVANGQATMWQPPEGDTWRWIVIGATIAQGDAIFRYEPAIERLTFLTPPPRQLERAVRLTGFQKAPWTWQVDAGAFAAIERLVGLGRSRAR